MRFGGIQKQSLIDFPGIVSAVVFTRGCNFHCPYCHNPSLVRGEDGDQTPELDEASILAFLAARAGFLDGVVVTGGEPLLWPDLPEFLARIKAMGLAVKLDTNGSRPVPLESVIADGLVDGVAMDIKTDPADYPPSLCPPGERGGIARSIDVLMASGIDHEFRTTCVPPFVDDAVIAAIARRIEGAGRLVLQSFRPDSVLRPEFCSERSVVPPTAADLERYRSIAAGHVRNCEIR